MRQIPLRQISFLIAAGFVGSFLAGCGGATSASLPAGPPGVQSHSMMLTLRLDAPAQSTQSSTQRTPQYLSPAMQSLVYVITGPGTSTTVIASGSVNLTPGSNYCTSSGALQPLTCTTQVPGTISSSGNYTFNVATYDAPQTAPCTPGASGASACSGKLLSDQDVAEPLTLGSANTVTLALGGVATGVTVTPLAPGYLQGDLHGLKFWGPTAQKLLVVAQDADGNDIVGPGAPSVAVTSASATLTVSAAGASAPNLFILAADTVSSSAGPIVQPGMVNLTVALTAPVSGGGSVPANTVVPATIAHSVIYVSSQGSPDAVLGYEDGNTTPSVTITNGVNTPNGVAVDGAGTLYAANYSNSTVTEYPVGRIVPSVTLAGLSNPVGVAVNAAGTLFVAHAGNSQVTEYPAGSTSPSVTLTNGISNPRGAAVDAASTLYIANAGNSTVTEYLAGSTAPSVTLTGLNYPVDVAVDAAGTLYLVNNGGTVTEYPAGSSSPSVTITNGLIRPLGAAVDASGTLYIANNGNGTMTEYPAGSTSASVTLNVTAPAYVAVVPASVQP